MSDINSDLDEEEFLSVDSEPVDADNDDQVAPPFERSIEGKLLAFAHEHEDDSHHELIPEQAVTLRDVQLEDFRTADPLDALHHFWQPQANVNHRLILPLHSDAETLRTDEMCLTCKLGYLLAIGKDIGLGPIVISDGLSG